MTDQSATTCMSCPYWEKGFTTWCKRFPRPERKHASDWCGEHPEIVKALKKV